MRARLLGLALAIALAACHEPDPDMVPDATGETCPDHESTGGATEGMPCTTPGLACFVVNEFSTCDSATYTCSGGTFHRSSALGARDGAACAGAPLQSCTFEGNLTCDQAPTSASYQCVQGIWQAECACYGTDTCELQCPHAMPQAGVQCVDAGQSCPYGATTCSCVIDGAGTGHFQCQ